MTFALTAWATPAPVGTTVLLTTLRKPASLATSSATVPLPLAPVRRVHRVIPFGVGSPEMTPSAKRPLRSVGLLGAAQAREDGTSEAAASEPAPAANWRRES